MTPAQPVAVMASALALCRRHFVAAAAFSALVNLLYIVPTIYMLQVYDRVVPTQGLQTLAFLTLVLMFALITLALLDQVRTRLLVRAGVQLDAALAPLILDATLGRPDLPIARQALREFDTMRSTLTGPGMMALFDAPWAPIYVLVCFIVHPFLGLVALLGCAILPLIAWATERSTRARLDHAQGIAAASYASQDALLSSADSLRALGMRRAMVARQLRQRDAMLVAQTDASFAAGGFLTVTKFTRLALQSLALGIGALLAIENQISGGAIFCRVLPDRPRPRADRAADWQLEEYQPGPAKLSQPGRAARQHGCGPPRDAIAAPARCAGARRRDGAERSARRGDRQRGVTADRSGGGRGGDRAERGGQVHADPRDRRRAVARSRYCAD